MKKLFLSFAILSIAFLTYGQAVVNNATIPMSVTLNSILRLNVTAGGGIEFAVNTLKQYDLGIENSPGYDTKFTVASSVDFDVMVNAEDVNLVGSDLTAGTNVMPVTMIGYEVESNAGVVGIPTTASNYYLVSDPASTNNPSDLQLLTSSAFEIITSIPVLTVELGGAGDILDNQFTIHWELATPDVVTHALQPAASQKKLLQQGLNSDRYSTSVFLSLKTHD